MSRTKRDGASADPDQPAKLTPRSFKDIPEDRPAKALGEYLRKMLRDQDILPDWMTRTGTAKNTITTTMDGRYKGWPSIEKWLEVFVDERVGGTYTQQQYDHIRELHEEGRKSHQANTPKVAKPAPRRKARKSEQAAPAPAPGPAPPPPAPRRFPASSASLHAQLPRREPGMRLNVAEGVFLDDHEAQQRQTELRQEALRKAQEAWQRRAETLADAPPGHCRYIGRAIAEQTKPHQPLTATEILMYTWERSRGTLYSAHSREDRIRAQIRSRFRNTLDAPDKLQASPPAPGLAINGAPGDRTPLPTPQRPKTTNRSPRSGLRVPRQWTSAPPIPVTVGLILLLTGLFTGSGYVVIDQILGWV
ncbi:hypothetical protein ACQP2Y_46900 (plasmid) [Actinoplanes sp. CA-051413]|uniref:hypothetical protein n=1 Tax=Actinoplanes sp. CA-051413 TaxID=3239899 RepID=UPI003D96DC17